MLLLFSVYAVGCLFFSPSVFSGGYKGATPPYCRFTLTLALSRQGRGKRIYRSRKGEGKSRSPRTEKDFVFLCGPCLLRLFGGFSLFGGYEGVYPLIVLIYFAFSLRRRPSAPRDDRKGAAQTRWVLFPSVVFISNLLFFSFSFLLLFFLLLYIFIIFSSLSSFSLLFFLIF